MKRSNWNLICLMSFFFITGCGNIGNPNYAQAPANAFNYGKGYSYSSPTGVGPNSSYQCPNTTTSFTITGAGATYTSLSDGFFVCPNVSKQNTSDILLQGNISGTNAVCVFPARSQSSGDDTWIPDPNSYTPKPLYQCVNLQSDSTVDFPAAAVSFPSIQGTTQFNAVYVVAAGKLNSMVACLLNYNDQSCPAHFFGRFR